jgi:hypothetical protein
MGPNVLGLLLFDVYISIFPVFQFAGKWRENSRVQRHGLIPHYCRGLKSNAGRGF